MRSPVAFAFSRELAPVGGLEDRIGEPRSCRPALGLYSSWSSVARPPRVTPVACATVAPRCPPGEKFTTPCGKRSSRRVTAAAYEPPARRAARSQRPRRGYRPLRSLFTFGHGARSMHKTLPTL